MEAKTLKPHERRLSPVTIHLNEVTLKDRAKRLALTDSTFGRRAIRNEIRRVDAALAQARRVAHAIRLATSTRFVRKSHIALACARFGDTTAHCYLYATWTTPDAGSEDPK